MNALRILVIVAALAAAVAARSRADSTSDSLATIPAGGSMADTLGHSAAAADSASFRKPPGLGTRASRAVRNFTADSWYVVTSPARIQQIGWVKPLAVIGTTALLYAYDEEITRGFHR